MTTGIGGAPLRPVTMPTDAAERKNAPVFSGVLRYFPDAIIAVAALSKKGNDQHNPGKPLHWDRSKSGDEGDALLRHLLESGTLDTDGVRHSAKVAWRALALLQKEIEADTPVKEPCPVVDGFYVTDRPWIVAPDHAPLLADSTRIRIRLRDGFEADTTVGGVAWGPCCGSASVAAYKLLD